MHTNGDGIGESKTPGMRDITATQAIARMRRAVADAARGQSCREELQSAARALVEELRAANEPPEQMLLHIKEILAEAGLRPTYASDSARPVSRDEALYRDVIMWSIRHYYEHADAR